jgi:SAM-dependent methyltransferase
MVARMEPQTSAADSPFEMRARPCPTCGIEAERTLGMRGGEYHRYRMGVATRIVQCERCSLIFPNPFPYGRNAAQIYGDAEQAFSQTSPRLKEICQGMLAQVREMARKTDPSVLDVGCGRAHLLGTAKEAGLTRLVGLEIARGMIEDAKALYGIELLPLMIEDYARTTSETFDAVILSGVLEHVYDPDEMIACVRKLTHPGSTVYIDVPCEPSLLTHVGNRFNRLRGDQSVFNLSPTWPPYHVFGFNKQALTTLLKKHGFVIERLEIWAAPEIPARGQLKDKVKAFVGTQINRLANVLKMSNNMSGWARRQ